MYIARSRVMAKLRDEVKQYRQPKWMVGRASLTGECAQMRLRNT